MSSREFSVNGGEGGESKDEESVGADITGARQTALQSIVSRRKKNKREKLFVRMKNTIAKMSRAPVRRHFNGSSMDRF